MAPGSGFEKKRDELKYRLKLVHLSVQEHHLPAVWGESYLWPFYSAIYPKWLHTMVKTKILQAVRTGLNFCPAI